jgi:hypothetical protein
MTGVADFGKPRRIVTGMRPDGQSYFARVEEVEEVDYEFGYPALAKQGEDRDLEIYRIWASDQLPVKLPADGRAAPLASEPTADETPDALRRTTPQPAGPEGMRISLLKFKHGDRYAPADGPRLHWHNTFDIQWVVAGELVIIMDDGTEETLRPGDAVVQHGTNHAWEVRSPEGAVVCLFMLGASRVGASPPAENRHHFTPELRDSVMAPE